MISEEFTYVCMYGTAQMQLETCIWVGKLWVNLWYELQMCAGACNVLTCVRQPETSVEHL